MTEALFRQDAYRKECAATVLSAEPQGIVLDATVFYPMGGGQPGDSGGLIREDGSIIAIKDAVKGQGDAVVHIPGDGTILPRVGEKITARIDWERRYRHMRMHTTLHLLCAVVTGDVTGGQVGDGKGRLDFNVPGEALDKDKINAELNRLIGEDHPVVPEWISDEEMAARPDLVRTMSVKPPSGAGRVRLLRIQGVDLQPCGGTHVARTGEIGGVEIVKIENKGKQNRRINLRLLG